MNIFQWTKGVFRFGRKKNDPPILALKDPVTAAQTLQERYGEDFTTFLYRRDLYDVLNREALPLLQPTLPWHVIAPNRDLSPWSASNTILIVR